MRRALIFRRHECLGESVSSNLSLSLFEFKARDARTAFFFFALTADDRAFPLGLCLSKKATDGTARSVVRAAPRV